MSNVQRKKVKTIKRHLKDLGLSDLFIKFSVSTENNIEYFYKSLSKRKRNETKRND